MYSDPIFRFITKFILICTISFLIRCISDKSELGKIVRPLVSGVAIYCVIIISLFAFFYLLKLEEPFSSLAAHATVSFANFAGIFFGSRMSAVETRKGVLKILTFIAVIHTIFMSIYDGIMEEVIKLPELVDGFSGAVIAYLITSKFYVKNTESSISEDNSKTEP